MTATPLSPPRPLSRAQLWVIVITRLVVNSAFRLVYPLLPFLALRLQVSDATVNLLITIQVTSGLLSLAGGMIADRAGDRQTMGLGLLIFTGGGALCALADSFLPFFLGYAIIGLGTAVYVPAAQSYVSRHTPYNRRARALGTVELGWSLAGIIGMPLLSRLVESSDDWSGAFIILGAAAIAMLAATFLLLPPDAEQQQAEAASLPLGAALRRGSVGAMAAALFLALAGTEVLFIVQSAWQQQFFGLSTAERGNLFGMIGFAEMLGAIGVALLVDRIGVRRAVVTAYALTAVVYLLLPLTLGNLLLYGAMFLLLGLCFEFSLVASFPLLSELAPEARGTTIAFGTAALASGRAVGSALGEPIWRAGGHWANGIIAFIATATAVLILLRYVREANQH